MSEADNRPDVIDVLTEAQRILDTSRNYNFFLSRETAEYWYCWADKLDRDRRLKITKAKDYASAREGPEDIRITVAEVLRNALRTNHLAAQIPLSLNSGQVDYLIKSHEELYTPFAPHGISHDSDLAFARLRRGELSNSFNQSRKAEEPPGRLRRIVNKFRPPKR